MRTPLAARRKECCATFFPRLQVYPEDRIFQQDGASSHYYLEVGECLDGKLHKRWIGRGSLIEWS